MLDNFKQVGPTQQITLATSSLVTAKQFLSSSINKIRVVNDSATESWICVTEDAATANGFLAPTDSTPSWGMMLQPGETAYLGPYENPPYINAYAASAGGKVLFTPGI